MEANKAAFLLLPPYLRQRGMPLLDGLGAINTTRSLVRFGCTRLAEVLRQGLWRRRAELHKAPRLVEKFLDSTS